MPNRDDAAPSNPQWDTSPADEPVSVEASREQAKGLGLARAARVLAVVPILIFVILSIQALSEYNETLSVLHLNCEPGGSLYTSTWCDRRTDDAATLLQLAIIHAAIAIGLAALLIVECFPDWNGRKWEMPSVSMTVVAGITLFLSTFAYAIMMNSSLCSTDDSGAFWAFSPVSLFVFGIGCIKLSTLRGRFREAAVTLAMLNGLTLLLILLYLLSVSSTLCAGPAG